jgi:hypothetical protein
MVPFLLIGNFCNPSEMNEINSLTHSLLCEVRACVYSPILQIELLKMDLSVDLAVDLFEPNIDNAKPCQDVVSMRQFPPNTIFCSLRLGGLIPPLEVIASDSFLDRSFLDSSLSSEGPACNDVSLSQTAKQPDPVEAASGLLFRRFCSFCKEEIYIPHYGPKTLNRSRCRNQSLVIKLTNGTPLFEEVSRQVVFQPT